jgi:hypothetical protein
VQLTEAEIEKLRQSGIRLDGEGRFWHDGQVITHHGLVAALWRWLDRNPDGRYVLRLDERRFVYLDVDDAPYVVRSLRWEDGRPIALLSDGSEEAIDPDAVALRGETPYVRVKQGRFDARLTPSAWGTLSFPLDGK